MLSASEITGLPSRTDPDGTEEAEDGMKLIKIMKMNKYTE